MADRNSLSLAGKLMFYSALVVILAISVMGVLFTIFFNSRFKEYLREESRSSRDELVQRLSNHMDKYPELDTEWLKQFSNVYMEEGMFISLNSEDGEILWSCLENNSEMCNMHLEENNPEYINSLLVDSYKLPAGSEGTSSILNISYASPDEYSGNDLFFFLETMRMLIFSMVISLVISIVSAIIFSKTMSRPLVSLAAYSMRLSNHDYSATDTFEKGTKEIDELHEAIARLAGSLESQEKLRKRLTSDISHELRTPLTSIQTYLEAMIDGIFPCNEERLQSCHDEILRLTDLVKGLENLHSYDAQITDLSLSNINLESSIKSVFSIYEKDLFHHGISWSVSCKDIFIMGDESKLKQVWINLISNSMKFTDTGGHISVDVFRPGPVILSFRDNGSGIDKEDLPNVFERFYKGDESRNAQGSGLGLSIVKEIITLHNGSISVKSDKNSITEFIIELPGNL
jgi:signal transduction histidine kinase